MEYVTITDDDKNRYRYKRYKGYAFQPEMVGNVRDQLEKISHFQCKPDDVLLGVFLKSGKKDIL